ncbi:MAG: hypothetical protein IH818_11485 [Acidobacteria bacterium]|nr:hypothetical protein [Acidobacteriota bacterium]
MSGARIDWQGVVLPEAVAIVQSYDTGVTLRQLFYRLVSMELIPNKTTTYKTLSRVTAQARRRGKFPALLDRTRGVSQPRSFESPEAARESLRETYRRDRTKGQPWQIFLGVEKHGLMAQLHAWFDVFGFPMFALGGYASETLAHDVHMSVFHDPRPSVLIYAGDFDPSGQDIPRDFQERAGADRISLG